MDHEDTLQTKISVFKPSYQDFCDFSSYIKYIESCGAHKAGIAKIIPPPEWNPRKSGYSDLKITIPAPFSQLITGKHGVYQIKSKFKKAITAEEFLIMAETKRFSAPNVLNCDSYERIYWKNILYNPPLYGADVSASLMDQDLSVWNFNNLETILDITKNDYGLSFEGINTSYLYFGMWKSTFPWHTEDMDLYSANYLHIGAPKFWYAIPPKYGTKFEGLVKRLFPENFDICSGFLRHKTTIISPTVLKRNSIPFNKIIQEQGEIIVTFPFGYHAGFNLGYNCAEAINFATPRWVEYGKRATQCSCRKDMVQFSMNAFVKRFQPERYQLWIEGKDVGPHPEDSHFGWNDIRPRQNIRRKGSKNGLETPLIETGEKMTDKKIDQCQSFDFIEPPLTSIKTESNVLVKKKSKNKGWNNRTTMARRNSSSISKNKKTRISSQLNSKNQNKSKRMRSKNKQSTGCNIMNDKEISSSSFSYAGGFMPPNSSASVLPSKRDIFEGKNHNLRQKHHELSIKAVEEGKEMEKKASVKNGIKRPSIENLPMCDKNSSKRGKESQIRLQKILDKFVEDMSESGDENTGENNDFNAHDLNIEDIKEPFINYEKGAEKGMNSEDENLLESMRFTMVEENVGMYFPNKLDVESLCSCHQIRSSMDTGTPNVLLFFKGLRCVSCPEKNLEIYFNLFWSKHSPYCSLCIPFALNERGASYSMQPRWQHDINETEPKPSASLVLLHSKRLFDKVDDLYHSSPLLICCECNVCVHASCYGVSQSPKTIEWKCDKCWAGLPRVCCCLCLWRGGAFKMTEDGRWAHILCAMISSEASIRDIHLENPICFPNGHHGPSPEYFSTSAQKCKLCESAEGSLIQCSLAHCRNIFHVTCALIVGARFVSVTKMIENGECYLICPKHTLISDKISPLTEGNRVCCRKNDTRLHLGYILDAWKTFSLCSWVMYADGTLSSNIPQHSLRAMDWNVIREIPEPGTQVLVRKYNGVALLATYIGGKFQPMYEVKFDDGTQQSYFREDIISIAHDAPETVKNILMKLYIKKENEESKYVQTDDL